MSKILKIPKIGYFAKRLQNPPKSPKNPPKTPSGGCAKKCQKIDFFDKIYLIYEVFLEKMFPVGVFFSGGGPYTLENADFPSLT